MYILNLSANIHLSLEQALAKEKSSVPRVQVDPWGVIQNFLQHVLGQLEPDENDRCFFLGGGLQSLGVGNCRFAWDFDGR